MSATIVIVEDDAQVGELVARYLERDGMTALTAATGQAGLALVQEQRPALVLLDVNLPDLDGWSILRRLHTEEADAPAVIMLTARSDEPDRLLGLDLGADDYIVKPFSPREVVARVKAVLRRAQPRAGRQELSFPGLRIDIDGRAVWRNGVEVVLTPKEFDLLTLMARQANRVFTRMTLYDAVWGEDGQGDDHTLDVHVNRLRKKLEAADDLGYLRTIKGVGFKFEVMHER